MTNNRPQDERTSPLRQLEARFKKAKEFILQVHPDEQIGDFVSTEGIETLHHDDLKILEVRGGLLVRLTERRADDLRAEVQEAERARAENLRRQNLTEQEARIERLERANVHLAAEIAKLKACQPGRIPSSAHTSRENIPQFLGQPDGKGRPAAVGLGGGGARLLRRGSPSQASMTMEQGYTRRPHPLEMIGFSGRRGEVR